MLTLNLEVEVSAERIVQIKLPDSVRPGKHQLLVSNILKE